MSLTSYRTAPPRAAILPQNRRAVAVFLCPKFFLQFFAYLHSVFAFARRRQRMRFGDAVKQRRIAQSTDAVFANTHFAMAHLFIGKCFFYRINRRSRHTGGGKKFQPMVSRAILLLLSSRGDDANGRHYRQSGNPFLCKCRTQLCKLPVIPASDNHRRIFCRDGLIRRDIGMAITQPPRTRTGKSILRLIRQNANHTIQQRYVYVCAFTPVPPTLRMRRIMNRPINSAINLRNKMRRIGHHDICRRLMHSGEGSRRCL